MISLVTVNNVAVMLIILNYDTKYVTSQFTSRLLLLLESRAHSQKVQIKSIMLFLQLAVQYFINCTTLYTTKSEAQVTGCYWSIQRKVDMIRMTGVSGRSLIDCANPYRLNASLIMTCILAVILVSST